MEFERIKTPGIAHNAYLLGTQGIGIVIDPRRDVDDYLEWAVKKNVHIKYVLQTHRQEDFILGSASLKKSQGVTVVAGAHTFSKYADKQLEDGEMLEIGELIIKALHTPGHTPESVSYAISMTANPEKIWAVFTGDALFIGETGRTDLPDRNKTAENAGILYDVLHQKILPLGDHVQIYPAHGAGSVCGGNIANYDESTIGFERIYNPVFTLSKPEFICKKMHERIPRPPYFKKIEVLNLKGGALIDNNWNSIPPLSPQEFAKQNSGIFIDTRLPESYAGGHIPGSYSIWLAGLPIFGGWVAFDNRPVFLILERSDDLKKAFLHLTRIGIDNIAGVLAGGFEAWRNAGLPIETSGTIAPKELHERDDVLLLDVREITEYEDNGHIPSAAHAYVGYLPKSMDKITDALSKNKPLVVTCGVGHRASLAVSMLKREGYKKVFNLLGGMTAWNQLNLPLNKSANSQLILDEESIKKDFP
jgi:hydroxyacylglutathione hydrolase